MGYTHYWTQVRDFTRKEWREVSADIAEILKDAEHNQGIPLANAGGEPGTSPEFTSDYIYFNGLGDDSHETMCVHRKRPPKEEWQRKRGTDFCKTAHKPYDLAVTAVLCYLATVTRRLDPASGEPVIGSEIFSVSSDGSGAEWVEGLEEARRALPRFANLLDIPMDIMQSDRWCAPWVDDSNCKGFEVHFCIDGCGYVLRPATGESYCFETHVALAQFLERNKRATFASGKRLKWGSYGPLEDNIWRASGSFDPERHRRIARAQARVLAQLFPVDPACAKQPPAYVRPGELPENAGRVFCYSVAELMKLTEATS